MSKQNGYLSKQFFTWIVANILGFGALGALLLWLPSMMQLSGFVPSTLIIAFPIALAQWLALRRNLQTSILWIITTPIGLLLAISIMRVIPDGLWLGLDDESIAALIAVYLLIGFVIGLPQWLILRRQLSRSSIWLLGSSIGVAAGFWVIFVTDLVNQSGIISYIVGVLVYSIVTGLVLTGLLANQNRSQVNLAAAT
jgi:hypothetical protein